MTGMHDAVPPLRGCSSVGRSFSSCYPSGSMRLECVESSDRHSSRSMTLRSGAEGTTPDGDSKQHADNAPQERGVRSVFHSCVRNVSQATALTTPCLGEESATGFRHTFATGRGVKKLGSRRCVVVG